MVGSMGRSAAASAVLWAVRGGQRMLQPDTHLDIVRERHSDLLRQARAGELARRLAEPPGATSGARSCPVCASAQAAQASTPATLGLTRSQKRVEPR